MINYIHTPTKFKDVVDKTLRSKIIAGIYETKKVSTAQGKETK